MKLIDTLREYVAAAFAGIWVQTYEPDEAHKEVAELCHRNEWQLSTWDVAQGLWGSGQGEGDPLFPVKVRTDANVAQDLTHITVLINYHRFLNNPVVVQQLANRVIEGKGQRDFFIVLSPVIQLPIELEKLFVVVEHPLPDIEALHAIAAELNDNGASDNGASDSEAIGAASGLTRYEAEGAFSLSVIRHERIKTDAVWELKQSILRKSGLLEMHRGQERFADLGGLESLKTFCQRALGHRGLEETLATDPNKPERKRPSPKGVLLLGVPGTGKSAFAKALGNETGRPTLTFDIGSCYGSLVGQTEERVRQALKVADAMAPCVLFVDEIEKALSGVGGQGDSGVSTRLFGTLLTWLNDHTSDVFFVGTCNDVSKLPPEFSRAERFDGIFFIDLPNAIERCSIWDLYEKAYGLGGSEKPAAGIDDSQWTGAEIRSCCRLAALLGVSLEEAAQHVVPVALTAADKVAALREWAGGRCLSASAPGIYTTNPTKAQKTRRQLQRS